MLTVECGACPPATELTMELFHLYAACLLLAVSSPYLLRLLTGARRHNLPPGRRPLPLVGNLFDLGALPHRSLAALAARHGPLMTLRLGAVTAVVASSADAARRVLQLHDAAFSSRAVPDAARACAHHAHSGEPPVARPPQGVLRRALRAAPPRRSPAPPPREGAAARVSRGPSGAGRRRRRRRPRGVHHHAEPALPRQLLGRPRGPRRRRRLRGAQGRGQGVHGGRRGAEHVGLLPGDRAARRSAAEAAPREGVQAVVRRPPKNDFLDVLLDYRSVEDDRGIDRQTMRSLLTDLFSAGSDTSAATVEWAMAELLQNPSSMTKARDELAQLIGSKREIEESDIGQLKYLQAIVKETFRLHPPGPFLILLPRQANATTEIGGYTRLGEHVGDRTG
ncbi:hypothetical protein ACP4OV_004442 [Aristida adscensionis]